MALPKRRHSRARVRNRRSLWKARRLAVVRCVKCNATTLAHSACPKCGYYRGEKADHSVKEKKKG